MYKISLTISKYVFLLFISLGLLLSCATFQVAANQKASIGNAIQQTSFVIISIYQEVNTFLEPHISILVIGDINTAGLTGEYMTKSGATPFQFVESELRSYDITIANLESNISEEGVGYPQPGKAFTFRGPVNTLDFMTYAGIDAVTLANNHTMDFTADALVRMMDLLDQKSIIHFGGGKTIDQAFEPKYITRKGITVGLISVNEIETYYTSVRNGLAGTAYFDSARLENAIRQADLIADVVIVMPHWGEEHNPLFNQSQQQWGRSFIDWGADMVIGNHPHIIQGSEIYNGKYIFYSLGNFIASGFSWIETGEKGLQVYFRVNTQGDIFNLGTKNVQIDYNGFPSFVE